MRPYLSSKLNASQPIRWNRWCHMALFALTTSLSCWSSAWGQAPTMPTATDITLTTKDNQDIKITYFKSAAGQEAPVVILLHGKGGNRLVWKSFAERLQKVDFAVITVDLRGHGESSGGDGVGTSTGSSKKSDSGPKRAEYLGMVGGDLEAVKKFLYEENQNKQLNMNKLGIVAADMSAPVAIAFADLDWEKTPYDDAPTLAQRTPRGQDVQAVALLSPEGNAPGLLTTKSLAILRNLKIPFLISVGSKNNSDFSAAKKMHEVLAPKKEGYEHVYLEHDDSKLRGTDLLARGLKTEQRLFNFLVEHVKKNKSEWRDRKSKLLD
ncbi:MAG: alpha/beta fold hydrolase [Planctomycetes bacterium]|nr:alpha/beta fold hydrolase [Planctomycetota bacterium]